MRFLNQLVLVSAALAATACAAAPAAKAHGVSHKKMSVKQVAVKAPYQRFPGKAMRKKSLRKFAKPDVKKRAVEKAVKKATAKPASTKQKALKPSERKDNKIAPKKKIGDQEGSTEATTDSGDLEYVCKIKVGGQEVNVDYDTGSPDLWIYSSELPTSALQGHSYYDPAKSTTKKVITGAKWQISYGDGSSASGDVYADTVQVGKVIVKNQAVELAQNVSQQFLDDKTNDGLLGLGFTSGNTITLNGESKPQNTFFANARDTLKKPLFTADLKHQKPGSYDFGFIDSKKYTGDIKYFPVDSSQSYWGVTSEDVTVDGVKHTKKVKSIVDTGTTLLLMPKEIVDKYYKKVDKAKEDNNLGGWVFPCNAKLPVFTIGFGSGDGYYSAVIPPKYMNTGPADKQDPKTCFGGLQKNDPDGSSVEGIYGDIFLKGNFVVFEAKTDNEARCGFALKPDTLDGCTTDSGNGNDKKAKNGASAILDAIKKSIFGVKKDSAPKITCGAPSTSGSPTPSTTTTPSSTATAASSTSTDDSSNQSDDGDDGDNDDNDDDDNDDDDDAGDDDDKKKKKQKQKKKQKKQQQKKQKKKN